jgi:hypothetical protein
MFPFLEDSSQIGLSLGFAELPAWSLQHNSVLFRIATAHGADRNFVGFPENMASGMVASATEASGGPSRLQAPQASENIAILDQRMLWGSALSFLPDGGPGDGAAVVLRRIIGGVHNFDEDPGKELGDIGDDLVSLSGIVDEVLVDRVPSATKLGGGIGISVAFLISLGVAVDNILRRGMSLDLDDINGMNPAVVTLPYSSPYVRMPLEGTSSSGPSSSERINHP